MLRKTPNLLHCAVFTGLLLLLALPLRAAQPCPQSFFETPLYPQARLCHLFDDTMPATLSYHADSTPLQAKTFYLEQLGQPQSNEIKRGRHVLQYDDAARIVVISEDGDGSQIDILIKG